MKITWFSHYFTPEIGAPSARIHELAREWLGLGHQVEVVTCFPNHPAGRLYPGYESRLRMEETIDGIRVYRHWTYITPNKGFARKTIGHLSFLPACRLLSMGRLARPNVAIGTSPTFFAAMAAATMCRKRRLPFVMEVRDLWPAIFVDLGVLRNRFLIGILERWELALYKKASKIVTVTQAFARNLVDRGVPAHKVHAVLNGADVEFWRPPEDDGEIRRRLNPAGDFVVLYLGAHGISQALSRILDCAQMLSPNRDIRFVFVGDGAEKESLQRKCREARLENVLFMDPVSKEKARELYAMADACLVPLRNIPLFDTFVPSKMFEIMAMGRPIVAGLRGEAAEILRRSEGAIITDPEDSEGIARAILLLREKRDHARALGERGRRFVERHYSRQVMAAGYAGILQEAVDRYRGERG